MRNGVGGRSERGLTSKTPRRILRYKLPFFLKIYLSLKCVILPQVVPSGEVPRGKGVVVSTKKSGISILILNNNGKI